MEITGKVTKILETQKFISSKTGKEIIRNMFVIEIENGQYPYIIAFTVMGAERFAQMGIVVGNVYNISFDLRSREYQGKYYTDVEAWKAINITGVQTQVQRPMYQQEVPQAQPYVQQAQQVAPYAQVPF